MSLEQRDLFIRHIFTTVAPYVDVLSSSFSFGFDRFWRREAVVRSGIHEGERVLDVCSGTGELAFLLSRRVGPEGSVTGADFCKEMLDRARRKQGGTTPTSRSSCPMPRDFLSATTTLTPLRSPSACATFLIRPLP